MLRSITAFVVVLQSPVRRRFNPRIYSWFGLRAMGRELLWKSRVVLRNCIKAREPAGRICDDRGVAMRVYHSIRGRNAHARRSCLSFFLYRLEIIAQILDALSYRSFIVVFEILEDGSPHRHLGRTVRRIAGTEPKDVGDVFPGKVSAMRSSECHQIRRRFAERRRDGTAAFAVGAVARRTIFPIHLATGREHMRAETGPCHPLE